MSRHRLHSGRRTHRSTHVQHDWRHFWEKYEIFTTKQRFRMADDVLVAEIFQVLLEGVRDGGSSKLDQLYRRQDDDTFNETMHKEVREKLDTTLRFLDGELHDAISGVFSKHYHVLMLAAAYAHHVYVIPKGDLTGLPSRSRLATTQTILDRLAKIEDALSSEKPAIRYEEFVKAASSSTHRIASRRVRFSEFVTVLADS
jgi:hypothetical protein